MKRSLRNSILLLLTAMLLTVSALADSGPKAQLTVKVVNAPSEPYYLDLLEKGDYQGHTYGSGDGDDTYSGIDWSYSEEEIAALDDELLDALRAAVPEGWHACTAQGTNGAPMWGDLIGSDAGGVRLHSFRYHGVPDTYRIILVTKSGESWVSDTLHRATLQSSATVDWAKRTASAPSAAVAYLLQFFCMLLPTLLIEGVLLLAFGYRSRRSLLVFLLVNLVTQGGFALYLAVTVLNHGVSGWSLLFYSPLSCHHARSSVLLYRWLLTEEEPRTRGGLRHRRQYPLRDGGASAHRPAVAVHRQYLIERLCAQQARKRKEFSHGNGKAVLRRPISDGV
ncbi:MAG: hypothetical protein ACLUEU_13980 [Oscillospiraceae bacterium]